MEHKTQLFIDGQFVDAEGGATFDNLKPATGEKICEVSSAQAKDIDTAVASARACLEGEEWGYKSTGVQRAVILRKLGEIFTENKDKLIVIESLDHGKPKREADADVGDAISACEHFAKLAEKQDLEQDESIENGDDDMVTHIRYEPIGVIGAITPWNFPLLMAVWKVVPSIAAGCAMVLKPSELAPLSCLLLGEMCSQAGLPKGALNVVPGLGPTAGAALSNHPGVDKLSFTGSVPTAQRIMQCAAGTCLY